MLMSVRDMDVLRLLCWCQNVRPDDLSSISTETERENLITLGLIKRHQRSDTLLLTNSGRAFLQAALEGDVPNLTLSYHDAAIERRVRLSSLMMTAYHAGINVFTITANSLAEPSTLFITAITRSRGHNPWGSARVGAIAHLGSTYYAVHYIYSGIGRMAVNDELAAFHNHTNFGKDTQRAFLFAGASYADIMEELKARDEKRDAKLIRYSEAYRGFHYPVHLLSCDETGARQLQIMAVPDYRVKISKLMLRSAYRPPPEDAPAWDATYQNRPFVIGADMNLRRIDAAIASAKKRGCLPISLAALDAQGDAVLLRRYKDTGYAVIYKVTESVLTELFGHPPSLYLPPCTQYLTKKGAVVDAPLNRAQASRRQASRSQRRFFAAREDLHAVGSRITCRMLAVGPRRCLVDCYGYDLDMTQREIRYAAIPDLRTEFHPGSEIDCIVKEYHPRTGELIVSAKETEVNPFFGAEERHPVGSRRFAMISGKYGGGVFCNLPDGVTCMCNYSYQHEDADFMVGEHVMLMVQRYDQEKLQMYGKIMSKW